MSRVLVTRPEPGADATARRLRATGHEPVVLPLSRIVGLPIPDSRSAPVGFDAVLATSANAIRHAPRPLVEALLATPLLAVGERTAALAREAGFVAVESPDGDAQALADLVSGRVVRGARLLYLAGARRGTVLEERLRDGGYLVEVAETYDAPEIRHSTDTLLKALGTTPLDFALVYSPRAGLLLSRLVARPEIAGLFEKTTFLAISPNAGAALGPAPDGRVSVAALPNEDALLALLPRS